MAKFNKKKEPKTKRCLARLALGGKWHVVIDEITEHSSVIVSCSGQWWLVDKNNLFGLDRNPSWKHINPRKICKTCARMERSAKFLESIGFVAISYLAYDTARKSLKAIRINNCHECPHVKTRTVFSAIVYFCGIRRKDIKRGLAVRPGKKFVMHLDGVPEWCPLEDG